MSRNPRSNLSQEASLPRQSHQQMCRQSAISSKSNATPDFVTTNIFPETVQLSKPILKSNFVRVASILESESSSDSKFFFVFYLHKLNRIIKYFYSRRRWFRQWSWWWWIYWWSRRKRSWFFRFEYYIR